MTHRIASAGRMKSDERSQANAMKSDTIANTCRLRLLFTKLKSVVVVTTLLQVLLLVGFGQAQAFTAAAATTTSKKATTIATTIATSEARRATARRRKSAAYAYNCHCSVSPPSSASASTTRLFASSGTDNIDIMQGESGTNSLQFGRFTISAQQIFYASPTALSAAIVNLRPIVPGHVLVISTRVVPHLSDLTQEEYLDLWTTVRKVQTMPARKYFNAAAAATGGNESANANSAATAAAFNVAVQDGRSAGQSVPHVHVHILPRMGGDFERNDDVYDELEAWAPTAKDAEAKKQQQQQQQNAKLEVLEDADRKDRTMEQMGEEAKEYRKLMNAMGS